MSTAAPQGQCGCAPPLETLTFAAYTAINRASGRGLVTVRAAASSAAPGNAAVARPRVRGVASGRIGTRGYGTPRMRGYARALPQNIATARLALPAVYARHTYGFDFTGALQRANAPLVTVIAHGTAIYPGQQIGARAPIARSMARSTGSTFGVGQVSLLGRAAQIPKINNFVLMGLSPGAMQIVADAVPVHLLGETLQVGGALNVAWIQTLQDRLRIASTPTALLDALHSLGEHLSFKDMVGIAYAMLVQETVSIGGTPTATLRHALQLADALTLVSGVGSALDAQVTVATAFALADSLASVYPNALAENVDLTGAAAATLRATLKLLDAMRVQDGVTPGVTWLVQTADTFELTDANATTATMGMLLADGVEMLGELRFEDGAYLAWVVNAETRAFVKYRNFPFNSFARIGNRYFGCAGDGIYELAGDDDNGEPIEAVVRGGLSDMGSSLLKNMPSVYIGYRGTDQMVLKVTVMTSQMNGDLTREEHWYRMEPRQANALRENRVKLGRGLISTYWGWELTNINGADFNIDTFSWYPVVLERRLN